MKKIKYLFQLSAITLMLCSLYSKAQDISGTWQGKIFILDDETRIVFHIQYDSVDVFTASMDNLIPGGEKTLKVEELEWNGDSLYAYIPKFSAEYSGNYNKQCGCYAGFFKQNGIRFPLKLFKGDADDLLYKRPQKPLKPYPYLEEEVTVISKSGDTLAGTLTKPNASGKFPAAILVTGSGPEDRDETILGHKPFLVLSDYLTRKGFAVLRCDDRGTAKSTGNFKNATSGDFADDAEAQVKYLKTRKDIDEKKIGLIGHSEGGCIVPMVAARNKDVAFVVLMAGPGIDLFDLLLIQDSLVSAAEGTTAGEINKSRITNKKIFGFIKTVKDSAVLADSIDNYLSGTDATQFEILSYIRQYTSNWMRWFVGYDPRENLSKLQCAVLAINGEKDVQVPAEVDIASIDETLKRSGNKNYKTEILPGLNHLFQRCKKCSFSEYIRIEETIDPTALSVIGDWMEKNFLPKQ